MLLRTLSILTFVACALPATSFAASEGEEAGRASFPPVSDADAAKPARESPLATLTPNARAALPDLPKATPPPPSAAAPPAAAPPPSAAPNAHRSQWQWSSLGQSPSSTPYAAPRGDAALDQAGQSQESTSDRWMLSFEAVTHAPVDIGIQAGLETPIGLRFFGGYGWMPGMYRNMTVGTAAQASDKTMGTLLDKGLESGTAWRATIGIRPFSKVGVYLDAGYSRVSLHGTLDPNEVTDVPELAAMIGSYDVNTTLNMWLVELGYQAEVGGRVVLAAGIGAMGTLSANTNVTPASGGATDPNIEKGAAALDQRLEKYGVIPTLTLRLGLDVI